MHACERHARVAPSLALHVQLVGSRCAHRCNQAGEGPSTLVTSPRSHSTALIKHAAVGRNNCVCVCVCLRETQTEHILETDRCCACVRACVCVRLSMHVCVCVCVCVCVGGERERGRESESCRVVRTCVCVCVTDRELHTTEAGCTSWLNCILT